MATKNEKILGKIGGVGIGAYLTYQWANKQEDIKQENVFLYALGGGILGGLGGNLLTSIFGTPNDTINYTHFHKGKRVYEGITYSDRFKKRMSEHKANGKLFTRVVKDNPKPRLEALKLEKERIKKYNPINNIQHNK